MATLGEALRQIADYGAAVELERAKVGRISAAGLLRALRDTGELDRRALLVWEREEPGPHPTPAAPGVLGRVYLYTASGVLDRAPAVIIVTATASPDAPGAPGGQE